MIFAIYLVIGAVFMALTLIATGNEEEDVPTWLLFVVGCVFWLPAIVYGIVRKITKEGGE